MLTVESPGFDLPVRVSVIPQPRPTPPPGHPCDGTMWVAGWGRGLGPRNDNDSSRAGAELTLNRPPGILPAAFSGGGGQAPHRSARSPMVDGTTE